MEKITLHEIRTNGERGLIWKRRRILTFYVLYKDVGSVKRDWERKKSGLPSNVNYKRCSDSPYLPLTSREGRSATPSLIQVTIPLIRHTELGRRHGKKDTGIHSGNWRDPEPEVTLYSSNRVNLLGKVEIVKHNFDNLSVNSSWTTYVCTVTWSPTRPFLVLGRDFFKSFIERPNSLSIPGTYPSGSTFEYSTTGDDSGTTGVDV